MSVDAALIGWAITGGGALIFAAVSIVLAFKLISARDTAADRHVRIGDLEQRAQGLEAQLQQTARECADEKARHEKQLAALRQDISQMEADLDACTTPDARRARLERLLSKAAGRATPDRGPDAALPLPPPPTP